jgi:predicted nucleotidyltransferase
MARRGNSRTLAPRPSVPNPRPHLLNAVLAFVRAARSTPGVLRIALLGSLATEKPVPKDADVLVTIDPAMDLAPLGRLGRRLQETAQTINLAPTSSSPTRRGATWAASATTASATHAWPAERSAAACGSI